MLSYVGVNVPMPIIEYLSPCSLPKSIHLITETDGNVHDGHSRQFALNATTVGYVVILRAWLMDEGSDLSTLTSGSRVG